MTYDTILGYLDGSLRYADAPSTVYVAAVKGYPDFVKIGFCQLGFRNQRKADPYISEMLYESCKDEYMQIMHGDLRRDEAFLLEQWYHDQLTHLREAIPELLEMKWSGRFETFRIGADRINAFVQWIADDLNRMVMQNQTLNMLSDLVSTGAERELLIPMIEAERIAREKRMARAARLRVKA